MPPPARPTRLLRALAALAAVLLVSATAVTAAVQHHCIHDEIRAKQFDGQSLPAALATGRFSAAAELLLPRGGVTRASASEYAPIRIKVYTEDVYDSSKYCTAAGQSRPNFQGGQVTCTAADVLTPAKQTILAEQMIPAAAQMHAERLSVKPLGTLTMSAMSGSICSSFTVPASVLANGVSGADYIIFVAAGPTPANQGVVTVAWATACQYLAEKGRPVVGVINVNPQYIDGTNHSVRVMAHEMLHALGFSGEQFQAHDMISVVNNLRDIPSTSVVSSSNTLSQARQYYGCKTMPGMELDIMSGNITAMSHWSMRNALEDIMCGYSDSSMRYSAITIAAMEDLGFYKGNYAMAEDMAWGNNIGCTFINNKCVQKSVSQFGNMFCNKLNGEQQGPALCSADHLGLGYCPLAARSPAPPKYFQYFSVANLGGEPAAEYCPIPKVYSNLGCMDGDSTMMEGLLSAVGPQTRCLNFAANSNRQKPVCVQMQCSSTSNTYSVKFLGSSRYVKCPAGSTINADDSSSLFPRGSAYTCPTYLQVCPSLEDEYLLNEENDGVAARAVTGLAPVLMASLALLLALA